MGRALAEHLNQQGHEIIGLVHDLDMKVLAYTTDPIHAIWLPGDIRDYKRLREILYDYKPDAIIHLAAQAIVRLAHDDPLTTFDVNVGGTVAILNAWKHAIPESYFLHFSTDKVYGTGMNKHETDLLPASGPYETSKAAGDMIAQSYGVTVTRTCNIYGPGDRNKRIIPNTIQQCQRGESPIIYQKAGKREYIYISDVCEVVGKLVSAKKTGIWNIASGQVLSNEQVVKEICKHYPTITPKYAKSPPWLELEDQSLNTEKLCSNVDCLSFVTFQEGIQRTVNWWNQEAKSLLPRQVTVSA